jgi:hypothetical protein
VEVLTSESKVDREIFSQMGIIDAQIFPLDWLSNMVNVSPNILNYFSAKCQQQQIDTSSAWITAAPTEESNDRKQSFMVILSLDIYCVLRMLPLLYTPNFTNSESCHLEQGGNTNKKLETFAMTNK